jgi:outer membrane protein assembly factor BamB
MSKNNMNLLLAISVSFLLFLSVVSLPLNAYVETQFSLSANPKEENISESLAITQNPWPATNYNASNVNFNPDSPGPSSNHILWIGKARPYEGLNRQAQVVAGKVLVSSPGKQSIYGNTAMLYAFDQNTGAISWTYPGMSGAGILIDEQHFLRGSTMIDPHTGQFLYKVPRGLSLYVPELKMGFGSGPSPGRRIATFMAWDFSDPENPESLWITEPYEFCSAAVYDDGKVFFGGRDSYSYIAADAMTGAIIWEINVPDMVTGAVAGYGKVFLHGWGIGILALDQDTGQILWRFEDRGDKSTAPALAYGKVYVGDTNYGVYALDADAGEIVWQYRSTPYGPYPHGPDAEAWWLTDGDTRPCVADGKVYVQVNTITRVGGPIPANWVSEDGLLENPHNYECVAQTGIGKFVCLDAEHGKLIWKCGIEEIGSPGPMFGGSGEGVRGDICIADGKVFGVQMTMTGHVSVGSARPYSLFGPEKILNYEWFPPYVYCFGKGPTQIKDVTVDKNKVNLGELVTISGKVVDLSPPIDHISSLSTWSRGVEEGAPKMPLVLSFNSKNGEKVPFATVETDENGEFTYTWYPWETGLLPIIVESAGSDAYEAPDSAYMSVYVEAGVPDTVTLLEGALIITLIVAITLPIIIYIHKPKPQGK